MLICVELLGSMTTHVGSTTKILSYFTAFWICCCCCCYYFGCYYLCSFIYDACWPCCTEYPRSFLLCTLAFVAIGEVEGCSDTLLYRVPTVDFDSFPVAVTVVVGNVLLLDVFGFIVSYTDAGMRLLLYSVTYLVDCVRTGIVPNKMELTSARTSGPHPVAVMVINCACYLAIPAA